MCIDIVFINIHNVCKPWGRIRATCAPDEILILFFLVLGFCFAAAVETKGSKSHTTLSILPVSNKDNGINGIKTPLDCGSVGLCFIFLFLGGVSLVYIESL